MKLKPTRAYLTKGDFSCLLSKFIVVKVVVVAAAVAVETDNNKIKLLQGTSSIAGRAYIIVWKSLNG